jgi:aryl-alcohol dehydrogenase-like predicted oxidoreductase
MSHEMLVREIGSSGVTASAIGLGTWAIGGWMWGGTDEGKSIAAIHASLDEGISLVDTAPAYGMGLAEEIVGKAIRGRRDKVVLATKCGLVWHTRQGNHFFDYDGKPVHRHLGRDSIVHELEQSLKRLGTDYIDLFQLHGFDAMTPAEEVLSTLDQLVREGKIRYTGVSNFSGWHLMKQLAVADRYGYPRHVANQTYYSLVGRDYEWELMPLGLAEGVGAVVWSPLGWGRLTGKIRRGSGLPETSRLHVTGRNGPQIPDAYLFDVVDALDAVAREIDKTIPQVALNWLLQRPTVSTVIIGARNEEQLRQNLGAVGWKLTPAQIAKLDAASKVEPAYPCWHQRGTYPERNPPAV